MSYFVVIRGPLGVGKTTLAESVAKAVGGTRISIDEILERERLEKWEDGWTSQGSFIEANRFAAEEAESLMRRGTPAVIEGNFYWRKQVEDLLSRLVFPHTVFTLRAPLWVCIKRDGGRAKPYGKEAAAAVYGKVCEFDHGTVVDASGTLEETIASVLASLPPMASARGSGGT